MDTIHTDRNFEQELLAIRGSLLDMGRRAETMLSDCAEALLAGKTVLAQEIIDRDDEIDRLEKEIDGLCLRVLVRRQPLGSDLRFLAATLKTVTDIERIGDLCVDISRMTLEVSEEHRRPVPDEVGAMFETAGRLLRQSLHAFEHVQEEAAYEVILGDRRLDALYAQVSRALINLVRQNPDSTLWVTRIQTVAQAVHRIAGHTVNIAEKVIFIGSGRDVRHEKMVLPLHQRQPRGILFLCVENAARSQMAEGWARKLLPPHVKIWSAGSAPASTIDPRAVKAMEEVGVDISRQHPKRISDVPLNEADTIITLCTEEVCITLPGIERQLSWIFPDPAAVSGDPDEVLNMFRIIRDELKRRIETLGWSRT